MVKNYFKTAWRNLVHNKNYTIINIAGLGIGVAVCMLIFAIIQFHSSFNNFHSKKDRIYRVLTEYHHTDSKVFYGRGLSFGLPAFIKNRFPQLERVAAIFVTHYDQVTIQGNQQQPDKKFKEENGIFFTQPSFFKIFDFPLLAGSYETLKDPDNALVAKETAEKYFGDWKTAMGKTIKLNNTYTVKVSGILATIPTNTDLQLKIVVSYGSGVTGRFAGSTDMNGSNSAFSCYFLLPPNISVTTFNDQFKVFSEKIRTPENKDRNVIQPLSEVHFDTQAGDYSNNTIGSTFINVLWLLAGFIMLIACVNFINLSTAQAVNRAKEVGVRKVLGSNKLQLKLQFITETFLIVAFSILVASLIFIFALPYLGSVLELKLSVSSLANLSTLLLLFLFAIVVTFLAGFYPSIVLSGFNPINALKSKIALKNSSGISLRRGLVVFQFVIAQALIIGTLVILKQMNYFHNQPLGFNKDAIVIIPFRNDSINISRLTHLKDELSKLNGLQNISFSSNTPIEDNNDNWSTFIFDHSIKETDFFAITKFADDQFVPTYQLPLAAGRNLYPSDTTREFLVNETLVKNLGIKTPQEAVGREIDLWGGRAKGKIAGVLKDFNDRSLRDAFAPVLISTFKGAYSQASIKLSTKNLSPAIESIKKIWDQHFPDDIFEFKFLDEKIESFYKHESQLATLYKIFAGIAIFLSCLGLYGLASFMAVQRIKEVGIRKVLGATAYSIIYLFSKEFILLISIAFLIATPVAWYYMHDWLQNFNFQVALSWEIFITGGIISVFIALITVSFQAIKAAIANPIKSLRTE